MKSCEFIEEEGSGRAVVKIGFSDLAEARAFVRCCHRMKLFPDPVQLRKTGKKTYEVRDTHGPVVATGLPRRCAG